MKSFTKAYELVVNNFYNSAYAFFLYFAFLGITFFSLIGMYMLSAAVISLIGNFSSDIYFAILGIYTVIFLLLSSGFKGAYIRMMYNILKNQEPNTINFLYFGLKFAHRFFLVGILKILSLGLVFSPIVITYTIDSSLLTSNILGQIFTIVYTLGIGFIVIYAFSLSYILIALFGFDVKKAIIGSIKLVFKKAPIFLPLYILYILSVIIGFIPILNFLSWFLLYPTVLISLIIETTNYWIELR